MADRTQSPARGGRATTTALANTAQTAIAAQDPTKKTAVQKFAEMVDRQFQIAAGTEIKLSPHKLKLAQHLGVKVEMSLAAAELKRQKSRRPDDQSAPTFTWENVNLEQLKVDAMKMIDLGLDAAMDNHIHPIARLNGRTGKYDVGLQIGYMGKAMVHEKFAIRPPKQVIYKLVFEGDDFDIEFNMEGGEMPRYKPKSFFQQGKVIGGFGWIKYEDPSMDRVIIVDQYRFDKARNASKNPQFWGGFFAKWEGGVKVGEEYDSKFERDMLYKTVVIEVSSFLELDPEKISVDAMLSMMAPEVDDAEQEAQQEISQNAGQQQLSLPPVAGSEPAEPPTGEPTAPAAETEVPPQAAEDPTPLQSKAASEEL